MAKKATKLNLTSVEDIGGYARVKIDTPEYTPPVALSDANRQKAARNARTAAEAVMNMASWCDTVEGSGFWSSLYERLSQIGETGDYTR